MPRSEEKSNWIEYIKNVLETTTAIMEGGGLTEGIFETLTVATNILGMITTFQTNKIDFQTSAMLVADIAQSITELKDNAGWKAEDVALVASNLEELEVFLKEQKAESDNWFHQTIHEVSQFARAENIAKELMEINHKVQFAVSALNLKVQIRHDVKIDETHDDVKKSIALLKRLRRDFEEAQHDNSEFASKLDKILDGMIQLQKTSEFYESEVARRNRAVDPDVVQSLEELQHKFDAKLQSERQSAVPLDISKFIKKWMLPSSMVEYDKSALIGQNATSNVFKGTYLGKTVAIKCFSDVLNTDSSDLERDIAREIEQWDKVSKLPFVSDLIGVCSKVSRPLIVSEWCPYTIEAYLEDYPTRLLTVVYELISGLASIHEIGVVHGDIKPSNILVSTQHHIKITDFSLSKSAITTMSRKTHKVENGVMINWTSPDMYFTARKAGAPADIWSFAMTVYKLLSKQVPYQGRSIADIEAALQHDEDRPERPANLNPELYPLWRELKKCWMKDPTGRPTAHQFQKFMEEKYDANNEPRTHGTLVIVARQAKDLQVTQRFGIQDPYVEIKFNDKIYKSTTHDNGDTDPIWNEEIVVDAPPKVDVKTEVEIRVMNENYAIIGDNEIGRVDLTLGQLLEARDHNLESHKNSRKGFKLYPKGHLVIEAYIQGQNASGSRNASRVLMKEITAVRGAKDIGGSDESSMIKSTVCVVGPSGVGKSTLVNSLLGRHECATSLWGQCTLRVQVVDEVWNLRLVDTPSYPSVHDDTPLRRALQTCRVAVLVFDKEVADVLEIAKMAQSYGCKLILVRNKRALLAHIRDDSMPSVDDLVVATCRKDTEIMNLLGLSDKLDGNSLAEDQYFYTDALAVLKARSGGERVTTEIRDAWISMLDAIRTACDHLGEQNIYYDLREAIQTN
ncbi:unnamed protein product [Aphanomyces euteiches]